MVSGTETSGADACDGRGCDDSSPEGTLHVVSPAASPGVLSTKVEESGIASLSLPWGAGWGGRLVGSRVLSSEFVGRRPPLAAVSTSSTLVISVIVSALLYSFTLHSIQFHGGRSFILTGCRTSRVVIARVVQIDPLEPLLQFLITAFQDSNIPLHRGKVRFEDAEPTAQVNLALSEDLEFLSECAKLPSIILGSVWSSSVDRHERRHL